MNLSGRQRNFLKTSPIPLLAGVVAALLFANATPDLYRAVVAIPPPWAPQLLGNDLTLRFLINDIFMLLFFGLATHDAVCAMRAGGDLYPHRRAANPLFAAIAGVVVPAILYTSIIHWGYADAPQHSLLMGAWAVPTATDFALAWVAARFVFGRHHPAVQFLLVLAILDDLLGLAIIALFYGAEDTVWQPIGLLLVAVAIALAMLLRRLGVRSILLGVVLPGAIGWLGLQQTPVHPSLALVFLVPLLDSDVLEKFHELFSIPVNIGLAVFGLVNAGVVLREFHFLAGVVLVALLAGKVVGVSSASLLANRFGLKLPAGMSTRDVFVVALLSGIGLTVALFVAGEAFPAGTTYRAAARTGALFSLIVFMLTPLLRIWIRRQKGRVTAAVRMPE